MIELKRRITYTCAARDNPNSCTRGAKFYTCEGKCTFYMVFQVGRYGAQMAQILFLFFLTRLEGDSLTQKFALLWRSKWGKNIYAKLGHPRSLLW